MSSAAAVAATPVADGLPAPRRYWALTGLWLAMAMTVIDSTATNIALPTIGRDFGIDPAAATWIVTAYQIAIVMTLLATAALAERLGYRRVYMGGLALFIAMSLACASARSFEWLAAFRFAQGLGAAAVMGVNGALIRLTWPKALLGRGLGYNGVVIAGTAAAGPALAAFLLSIGDWHWLFLVNIPAGLFSLVLAARFAPDRLPETDRFDKASAVLSAAAFGALFLAASQAIHGRWSQLATGLLLAGLMAGGILVRHARTSTRPLFPLDLIGHSRLRLAYAASICAFAAQMCLLVSMPFLLEGERRLSVATVGLLILPMPLSIALSSPVAGRWADRPWAGAMSAGGLCLLAVVLLVLSFGLRSAPPLPLIGAAMALCGLGFGLFQVPNNNVLLRTGPVTRAGAAAGMLTLCRLTGQTGGALIAALSLTMIEEGAVPALLTAAILALGGAAFARCR